MKIIEVNEIHLYYKVTNPSLWPKTEREEEKTLKTVDMLRNKNQAVVIISYEYKVLILDWPA